ARVLEARSQELLVGDRLQSAKPRLGGVGPAVHEAGGTVREPWLEGRAHQVRQALATRICRTGGPAPKRVDRRLSEYALLGPGFAGRCRGAPATRASPRHSPRPPCHRAPPR